ncbi:MAG: peptidyl-prolyl cis-trans isomerase [Planctomycetes bacterium]|nr:peptidyl-prolyl cis-trans isomerase [Planctomycetota bacterium]
MRKCIFWLVLAVFFTGCGGGNKSVFTDEKLADVPFAQRTGLPQPSGGFVLTVGGETITADEIIEPLVRYLEPVARQTDFEQFAAQARPQIEQMLVNRISNILLYKKAKDDAGEQIEEALKKIVDAEVNKFLVSFEGDAAKAEQALKEMNMDWKSFREYQKKMILSQSYMSSQLPEEAPITHSQLLDAYNRMKNEFFVTPAILKFQLIDIQTAKMQKTGSKKSELELARELADKLIKKINAGEDFGELAGQYSHGHRKSVGGLWKPVKPDSLAQPYDVLAEYAEKIQPGQIAPPIEVQGHIFIMKLLEKQSESVRPFEQVQTQVEAQVNLDRRRKAIDEFSIKIAQQAAFDRKYEFVSYCLREIYRISNQ